MELNSTGAGLSNGSGVGVWLDRKGQIALGNSAGAGHGNVVTTLTHPVCYVTGAPIMGSSAVTAASGISAPLASVANSFISNAQAAEVAMVEEDIAAKLKGL